MSFFSLQLHDHPFDSLLSHVCFVTLELPDPRNLRGPNWGLFCPEIRAFMGFGGEISSTVSKVLSDRKVLFTHKKWPLMAVNRR